MAYQDDLEKRDENVRKRSKLEKNIFSKSDTKRAIFSKIADDKTHKFGGSKTGCHEVPYHEEIQDSAAISIVTKDLQKNGKECGDFSLISNLLIQFEKQQSNLLNLLQKFIRSSQNGMSALEARVHSLELALDEISYDLAISNFPEDENRHDMASKCSF